MKQLKNLNIFHTSLAADLATLIQLNNAGNLAPEDIQLVRYEDGTCRYGIKHSMNDIAAGYENYNDAVEDYLKLQVVLGYRTTNDLWEMVKADYEDDEGFLIVEGCYTNDQEEEYTRIATVAPDTTLEDAFGNLVHGMDKAFPESVVDVVAPAIVRQVNRQEALLNSVHDDIVKQVNQGDTTVLFEMLNFIPHGNLIATLAEEKQKNFRCDIPE